MDILLIDDELQFLKSLAEGLQIQLSACGIFTACNGKDALNILQNTPIDVVVTDLNMPVMDGIEFLKQMQEKYPGVPTIIMSAQARTCVAEKIKSLRVFDYLEKPLDLGDMTRSILAAGRSNSSGVTDFLGISRAIH